MLDNFFLTSPLSQPNQIKPRPYYNIHLIVTQIFVCKEEKIGSLFPFHNVV